MSELHTEGSISLRCQRGLMSQGKGGKKKPNQVNRFEDMAFCFVLFNWTLPYFLTETGLLWEGPLVH